MAKSKDLRTDQEKSPHKDLVAVRNSVQECCKDENGNPVSRRQAAAMCNLLLDEECDDIVSAGKDAQKVKNIATRVQRAEKAKAAADAVKAKKRQSHESKK